MTRIQETLLNLLIELDELCVKNNIEYCLGGGCLIGAVRNGGFLPWDDDLDVHMTRENAERFYSIQDQFMDGRVLYTVKDYPKNLFPCVYRYSNTYTTMQSSRQLTLNHPTGQFIDIIILDDAPSSEEERIKQEEALNLYVELHTKNGTINAKRDKEFFHKYLRLIKLGRLGLDSTIENYYKKHAFDMPSYKTGDHYLIGIGMAPMPFIPKSFFAEYERVPFEGYEFPVPTNAEALIKYAYGDNWMYAPPATEENIHSFLIDLDIPIQVMDADHARFLPHGEYWNLCRRHKELWFRTQPLRQVVNKEVAASKGKIARLVTYKLLEESEQSIEELAARDPEALFNLFENYYSFQFSRTARYWNLFEPLDDETLYYAMLALLSRSDFFRCKSLIEKRKADEENPLPESIKRLEEHCNEIQNCIDTFYVEKDYALSKEMVHEALDKYPDDINLLRIKTKLMNMEAEKSGDYSTLNDEVERILELYPEDGELLIFQAKEYYRQGDLLLAKRFFNNAYNNTRNGFVLAEANRTINAIDGELANYIPNVCEDYGQELEGREREDWLTFVHHCMKKYYGGEDPDDCYDLVMEGLDKYPGDVNLEALRIRILNVRARIKGDYRELDRAIEEALERHPSEGQVLVYEGLKLMRRGRMIEARKIFNLVSESTDNIYDIDSARVAIEEMDKNIDLIRPDINYLRDLYEHEASSKFDVLDNDVSLESAITQDDVVEGSLEDDMAEEEGYLESIVRDFAGISDEEITALYHDRVSLINSCIDHLYKEDCVEVCETLAEEGLSQYPDDIMLLRLKYRACVTRLLRGGNTEEAANVIKKAIADYPEEGDLIGLLGEVYEYMDRSVSARRQYIGASRRTKPGIVKSQLNARIRTLNESLFAYRSEIDYSYGHSLSLEERDTWETDLKSCFNQYYGGRDYRKSKDLVEEAIKKYPEDVNIERLRIKIMAREARYTGIFDLLDEELENALKKYPKDGQFLVYEGLRLLREGKLLEAMGAFQDVLVTTDNIFDIDTAQTNLERFEDALSKIKPDAREQSIDRDRLNAINTSIELAYSVSPSRESLEGIENELSKYPGDPYLLKAKHRLIARIKDSHIDDNIVKTELKALVDSCPDDWEAVALLAEAEERLGNLISARRGYEKALNMTNDEVHTTYLLGKIRIVERKFSSYMPKPSEEQMESLRGNSEPELRACIEDAIEAYFVKEDYEQCKVLVNKGLSKYPKDSDLNRLRIRLLNRDGEKFGDYSELEHLLKELLRENQEDPSLLLYEGLRLMREGDMVQARDILEKVSRTADNRYDQDMALLNIEAIDSTPRDYALELDDVLSRLEYMEEHDDDYESVLENYEKTLATTKNAWTCEAIKKRIFGIRNKMSSEQQGRHEPYANRRNIYLTLLTEIDAVCRENKIKYFLIDDALRLLILGRSVANNLREVSIVMTKPEFEKFQRVFNKMNIPNRIVEGMDDNPNFPGSYYRYVATNTLFLNPAYINAYKVHGYAINIYIPIDSDEGSDYTLKNTLYEKTMRTGIYNKYLNKKKRIPIAVATSLKGLTSKQFLKLSEDYYNRRALRDTGRKSYIRFIDGTRHSFPAGTFTNPQDYDFGGYGFYTVADIEGYLEHRYGIEADVALRKGSKRIQYDYFCNTYIGYEDFIEEARSSGFLSDSFIENRKKYKGLLHDDSDYKNDVAKYINIWRRDGDRFKLWKYYAPLKSQIMNLYQTEDYKMLGEILKEYIEMLIKYHKLELGICFDFDILMVAIETIRALDEYDMPEWQLEEMIEFVPKEHLHENVEEFIREHAPKGYSYKIHEVDWADL